jgi:hypothetical protein
VPSPTTTSKSLSFGWLVNLLGGYSGYLSDRDSKCLTIICSNPALEFVADPALQPPEIHIDPALVAQYQKELADAANAPLPPDEGT